MSSKCYYCKYVYNCKQEDSVQYCSKFEPVEQNNVYINWSDMTLIKEGLENLKCKYKNTVKDRLDYLIDMLDKVKEE